MTEQTHDLTMPAFGADMATGTLIEWQVNEGDEVKRGDVIAVIETNKGAIELDIFEDTTIDKLLVEVDDEVKVGTPIARLRGPGPEPDIAQDVSADVAPAVSLDVVAEPENDETMPPIAEAEVKKKDVIKKDIVEPASPVPMNVTKGEFVLASPAARYQARIHDIDLASLAASKTQPITLHDLPVTGVVEQAQPAPVSRAPSKASKSTVDEKQMMRDAISDTVTLSKQSIPHYYLSHRLDVTALQAFVSRFNQDKEPQDRVLLAAPMLTAIARLLAKHTQLNGQYLNNQFVSSPSVHLAHAVNIRGSGLIMPVIRDAHQYDAPTLMQLITNQVAQARRGRLPMSQLTGATCCVSSIGERGAEQMSAIILPPQVAIVALGSPHQEALVIDGEVKVRDVIIASLAADHRVSDGHVGAKFLYQLNNLLQQPEQLWTESNYTS